MGKTGFFAMVVNLGLHAVLGLHADNRQISEV